MTVNINGGFMAKRSTYETIIVSLIVGLTLLLGMSLYAGRSKIRKSNLLIQELSMLRSGITLYKMVNGENPPALEELSRSTYKVDSTNRAYVDNLSATSGGVIVDPFGNAYAYDAKSGWIHTTTKNYDRW